MAKRPVQNDAVPIAANASAPGKEGTAGAEPDALVSQNLDRCRASHPIVGMVASAGGVEAFMKFFAAMPSQCGMAFVLVPHLDTSMKVRWLVSCGGKLRCRLSKLPMACMWRSTPYT